MTTSRIIQQHVYSLLYSGNGSLDVPCTLRKIPRTYYRTASLKGLAGNTACCSFWKISNNLRSAEKASIIHFWNFKLTYHLIRSFRGLVYFPESSNLCFSLISQAPRSLRRLHSSLNTVLLLA